MLVGDWICEADKGLIADFGNGVLGEYKIIEIKKESELISFYKKDKLLFLKVANTINEEILLKDQATKILNDDVSFLYLSNDQFEITTENNASVDSRNRFKYKITAICNREK